MRHTKVINNTPLGRQLASIWKSVQEDLKDEKTELESSRLNTIFRIRWLARLGIDIYDKTINELDIKETLWALGRILFVCLRLKMNEGQVGEIAEKLLENYYPILVSLRKHHDKLISSQEYISTSEIVSGDEILPPHIETHIETNTSYTLQPDYVTSNLLPDYLWWQGISDGVSQPDPLLGRISPKYARGEILGLIVKPPHPGNISQFPSFIEPDWPQVKQPLNHMINFVDGQDPHQGPDSSQDFEQLNSTIWPFCTGICNSLGCCASSVGDCFQDCNGDDHASNRGECCGYFCMCICGTCFCGGASYSEAYAGSSFGNGVHSVAPHGVSLIKTGAAHLALSAATFSADKIFAPTVGTVLTGAYFVSVFPPLFYNFMHSVIKLIKGGEREQTRSRDRSAGIKDIVASLLGGAGGFFGGVWLPFFGGPHSAITMGLIGILMGDGLSKYYRKNKERKEHEGCPKPGKYYPTMKVLMDIFNAYELDELPGSLQDAKKDFNSGKSMKDFLAAQEKMDKIANLIQNCVERAIREKKAELQTHNPLTHGCRGLLGFYNGLFGGHYRRSEDRKETLDVIKEIHQGNIATLQGFDEPNILWC
jgi:hypothetical protein